MASNNSSSSESSQKQAIMWEQGDSCTDDEDYLSHPDIDEIQTSPSYSAVSSQPTTPGLTTPMSSLDVSIFFTEPSFTPAPNTGGRPKKLSKFRGNQHSSQIATSSQSSNKSSSIMRRPRAFILHKRGYCSRFITPHQTKKQPVQFKNTEGHTTTKRISAKPNGMRILDIGILGDAIRKLRCNDCFSPLSIFESNTYGWQTTYSIKCERCHLLHAEFPSSKPMNVPNESSFVNTNHSIRTMNQVTMRSVLAVHCSGFSWRDLHKFSTIFDMTYTSISGVPRIL